MAVFFDPCSLLPSSGEVFGPCVVNIFIKFPFPPPFGWAKLLAMGGGIYGDKLFRISSVLAHSEKDRSNLVTHLKRSRHQADLQTGLF